MADCIFCKIVAGEIPSERVHEDEHVVAFKDVNPQAPHHLLVIPRAHVARIADLTDDQRDLAGRLLLAARDVAKSLGLEAYRLVVNNGAEAGQSVFHVHVHVLAGRPLSWPPG